jgi:HEAT repeat protein
LKRSIRPLALRVALTALLLGAPPAFAQEAEPSGTADLEDRKRIERLVRTLNNPSVLRKPGELRSRIDGLLSSRHPLARRKLRELLGDTGARTPVVEQIVASVIMDRDAMDLMDDVVERLRVEQDSTLAQSFDDELLRYADSDLVRHLAELARDTERPSGFRAAATTTLGRTGHDEALSALVDLWRDPDPDVRLAASRGFVRIVPFVRTHEEAERLVAEIRAHQLPLAEVLRRRLRELEAPLPTTPESDYRDPYVALARAALPHVPLRDVLELYLPSPLPELRAAAAARLRDFPWDAEPDAMQAQRAAGKALLRALRREEVASVEGEVLDTLVPLAPALREAVDEEELGALIERARGDGSAAGPVRRAAIRMLGALRDARAVAVLQDEFDALRDTDPELRIEILSALGAIGADITEWLARRVLDEPDVRVAREMVLKLGQATDPAAVGVFVELVKERHPDERLRLYVVQALASLWANNGVQRARDALIDFGLTDSLVAIREVSANGLGNPRPGERGPVLEALTRVLERPDEDVKVRVAAARAILDLDDEGALDRLRPMLSVGAIWDVVRNRRVEDLRGSHITVDDVLRDADALWAAGDPDLRERAVQLLQAVVDSGTDLWESSDGRGRPRERLVERLLASGRPVDACAIAEGLVAATPRDGDPRHRWRLLLGRALRACGSRENVARAERELTVLRGEEDLPAELHDAVALELGHALLQQGDPTGAHLVFSGVGDAVDLPPEDAARLRELAAEARERSDEERLRVLALVDRIAEPDAQEQLRELGRFAARHVDAALAEASAPVEDGTRLRQLLLATAALARRTFEIPQDATPEQIAEIVAEARAFLAAEIAGDDGAGER